jgi:hypothetical protein
LLADAAQPNEQVRCRRLLAIQISGILWRARSLREGYQNDRGGVVFFKNCYIVTATSMIAVTALVSPEMLVEIEADAFVASSSVRENTK